VSDSGAATNGGRPRRPNVGVAAVVSNDRGEVLLGRRTYGQFAGLWCIPCGYVEWDEDIREAAARELREETGLEVRVGDVAAVHSNFHAPEKQTVGVWFHAEVIGGELHPADGEFTEVGYWSPAAPPPLAFPTDVLVMEMLASRLESLAGGALQGRGGSGQ
jgi:ADP-ribose pyrophosphatase YjhB (NUDIX family)